MSPAFKSNLKDKKVVKDNQKAGLANGSSGVLASAYNPLLGIFHTLETGPTSSASSLQTNGRFRNIDETDEHLGAPLGIGVEYDSVSNNGSWSGESEEHKEKPSTLAGKPETIPSGDNDKREKIRQKNERKHQRQKEKRAQELHEKCIGYLMSRKLEALAQQLVAMGFSHERATMALILNEGRVEESVAWLFEGSEETGSEETDKTGDPSDPSDPVIGKRNLKIDVSEELAQISDMERKYNCTKQEVERAIVSTEGDLEKVGEILKALKQETPSAPEATGDPPIASNDKLSVLAGNQNSNSAVRPQTKVGSSSIVQRRRDDKEINYPKLVGHSESVNNGVQPFKRIQPKLDGLKSQQPSLMVDKRWRPPVGSNPPVSFSLASSLHAPPLPPPPKAENRYAVANEIKNLQPASIREPVIVMQRSHSANMKQIPVTSISSSPPISTTGWYPTNSNVEVIKSNGFMQHIPSARNPSPSNLNTNQAYNQFHYHQQQNYSLVGSPRDSPGSIQVNGSWSRTSSVPTLAAASSLGLFSGLGSIGTSRDSSVDWTTGSSKGYNLDYASIDWSLDRNSVIPRPNGSWLGSTSNTTDTHSYDFNISRFNAKPFTRHAPTNSNGVPILGLQEVGAAGGGDGGESSGVVGSREWTSPFEGKDIFSLPRQFVSSPSI